MKTTVATLRYGTAPWFAECVPTLENWCERHGYELQVWDDPKVWKNYPCPKFCEGDMLRRFLKSDADRLIYVDADVRIHPKAPAFPELKGLCMATDIEHSRHTYHWADWCEEHYGVLPDWWNYSNAGVWAIDRAAAKKFLAVWDASEKVEFFQEQDFVNYIAYTAKAGGMQFSLLPSEWNRYGRAFHPAWFWHLWGETKTEDLAFLEQIGILDKEPTALSHFVPHREGSPSSDKVVVHEFIQDAGLGNQMFEFAASLGIAKRMNLPLLWSWKPSELRDFGLTHFGIAENNIPVDLVLARAGQGNAKIVTLAEERIKTSKQRLCGISCPFQAEECFEDVAEEVRELFHLDPLDLHVPAGFTPVGVQVRRGDYVTHSRLNVVTPEYFLNAMRWMRQQVENPHFYVVSDDPVWCSLKFNHLQDVTVMPEQTPIDGLRTMVACDAHIISNSTFGWWGAWLNETGPVVVPEQWYNTPGSYGDWQPIPERWHRISTGTNSTVAVKDVPDSELQQKPKHERAIVIPWHGSKAVWQELRFCLRSFEKYFEDKTCPIYVLGTHRPPWLMFGPQRVRYINAWSYSHALVNGLQLADKILWVNDDQVLLKPTTWEDCEKTLFVRDVPPEFTGSAGPQKNPWREGCLRVLRTLAEEGRTDLKVYSTHTPQVFEREKALRILRKYGIWEKFPLELAYFNEYVGEATQVDGIRAIGLPLGDAQFLNYTDRVLTSELKQAIKERLSDFAPWELKSPFQI